jgi:hypothetical protein
VAETSGSGVPFPAWGINAQLDRRRYRVIYTDRGGHSREVIVHTRIGVIAEENSDPSSRCVLARKIGLGGGAKADFASWYT